MSKATVRRLRSSKSARLFSDAGAKRIDSSLSIAARNPAADRSTPHESQARFRIAASVVHGNRIWRGADSFATIDITESLIAAPARAPNTRASRSELLARRFAPWTPVDAASPAA